MKNTVVLIFFILSLAGVLCFFMFTPSELSELSYSPTANVSGERQMIVLEPILDRVGRLISHRSVAMQYLVTSELLRKYDCVIISRNTGLSLGLDRNIDFHHQAEPQYPQADWRIGGAHVIGRTINNAGWTESDTEIFFESLTDDQFLRRSLRNMAAEPGEAAAIAKTIASELQLPAKPKTNGNTPWREQIWAVLPFQILERVEDVDMPRHSSFSDEIEVALLESEAVRLVNRTQVMELLEEHKMAALGLTDPGNLAGIGRLLKADSVVWGLVTAEGTDLFLIDSVSGIIQGAVRLPRRADSKQAVDELLAIVPPELPERASSAITASPREGERMKGIISNAKSFIRHNSGVYAQVISIAEGYYLMIQEDDTKVVELAEILYDNLLDSPQRVTDYLHGDGVKIPYLSAQSAEQLYQVITFMLSNVSPRNAHEDLKFLTALRTGHFREAERLLENLTDVDAYERGLLYIGLKQPEKTIALWQRSGYIPEAMLVLLAQNDAWGAWQMVKDKSDAFECGTEAEMITEYLKLVMQFESDAEAVAWLEAHYKAACSPAHLMLLKSHIPLGLLTARIYLEQKEYAKAHAALNALNVFPQNQEYAEFMALQNALSATGYEHQTANLNLFDAIPDKAQYKIYLLPLNGTSIALLEAGAKLIQAASGLESVILPELKLPLTPCYDSERRQFVADKTMREMRKLAGKLPDDGVIVLGVMNESIYPREGSELRYVFYSYNYKPFDGTGVLSLSNAGNPDQAIAVTTLRLLSIFGGKTQHCGNKPCLMTSLAAGGLRDLKLEMCAECEGKIGNIDLDKANKSFAKGNKTSNEVN